MIEARFDDLSPDGVSFRLATPVGVVEARSPDEISGVLEAAQASADRGLWVAGFVAYEAAPGLDPRLEVRARDPGDPFAELPLAWFALFEERVNQALPEPLGASPPSSAAPPWRPSIDRPRYDAAVGGIRDLIADGVTYQINYTFRLRAQVRGDDRGLYRDLCFAQRSGHCAYLNLGRFRVLSASPELFFELGRDRITTRPMKGTAPRGRWQAEDVAAAERLASSAKDRAENAMIVDLLRNDLGRIAEPGCVNVERTHEAERYETVWQLTSTVSARLATRVRLLDVFRALFPSGSVTGAPKVSSMRVIAELEDAPRGVYTGAVGFLAPSPAEGPAASFNVAIRTVALDTVTGLAEYGTGGGVTWDSSPQGEYDEAMAKALVLTARRPRFELFETLRFDPTEGGLAWPGEHLDRIQASAEYFGFTFDRAAAAEALEKSVADVEGRARVRIQLARDGSFDVTVQPPNPEGPVRLALDLEEPVDPADPLVFHKTTLRAGIDRRRERHPDADDVVWTNRRGELTETAVANLAVEHDGRWWTPPLEAGLLAGVYRAVLLREGRIAERTLTPSDLRHADSLATISSVRLWRLATMMPG